MDPYLPFEFTHEGMLERVSALVQNQVSDCSQTCFKKLFVCFGGGGGGRGTTCDMLRKKITTRNMIEEASVKTPFTKYSWCQCSLNSVCVVNRRCIVPGGYFL